MSDFLIKSTISLTVLLAVYHLLLEKESMHKFNRFYLLFGIIFSLTIPFITIEVIQEIAQTNLNQGNIQFEQGNATVVEETNYTALGLWGLYGIVTLVLGIRFINNIIKISKKMKSNKAIDYKNAKLILVPEKTLPHTFLNVIFINKTEYENRQIEAELYTHELTHVTQKHTLDILFIELLKTVFWFNPVFIFYKKAIQLNHEFLADEKVVQSHNNVPFYQNLLVSVANVNSTYYLASNLNYSVTKKRLIMMTQSTSPSRALVKKGILIPLLTALVFSLCTKVVAQEKKTETPINSATPFTGMEKYFENTLFKIMDTKGNIISEKKFTQLTSEEKKNIPPPPPPTKAPENKKEKSKHLNDQKNAVGPKYIELTMSNTDPTYNVAEITEKPEYPDGIEAFYKFVGENFKISPEATANKLKGKVYVTFMVEKDGSLTDTRILREPGYGTGDEAIRVLKLCPNWIPGKLNGEPVKTMYSLPITIQTAN